MRRWATATLIVLLALAPDAPGLGSPPLWVESAELSIPQAFHIVGIAGIKRNDRVDLQFSAGHLQFTKKNKTILTIAYGRITRMQLLDSKRMYAKATYAAAVGIGLPGLLLMAKQRHVDSLLIDWLNDRGGQMGLIVQVPAGEGARCREWLKNHGVAIEEPDPLPPGNDSKP